ncbi:MAG: glycosyltransferase family 8 protein [Amaricoccus sp.]|uniref:glycosyltransferase family 8 protein n=1 Tax=Amaricoccus sp. TaxID=1872485 RepID=UPI003315D217
MHVVFCASANFFQHVAVAVTSLSTYSSDEELVVHVVSCDGSVNDEKRLRDCLSLIKNCELNIYIVSDNNIKHLFFDSRITKESYLRILVPNILPQSLRRVLYLDCDIVVLDDVRPLWTHDLGGKVMGAVPDFMMQVSGQPRGPAYVNAGVLLIDLEKWREMNLTEKMLEYAAEHREYLEYHDQDVINSVLYGKMDNLDLRWNVHAAVYRYSRRGLGAMRVKLDSARKRPAILHYTGVQKPWLFRSEAPKRAAYYRFLRRTRWRADPPNLVQPINRIEHQLDCLFILFGVDIRETGRQIRIIPGRLVRLIIRSFRRTLKHQHHS